MLLATGWSHHAGKRQAMRVHHPRGYLRIRRNPSLGEPRRLAQRATVPNEHALPSRTLSTAGGRWRIAVFMVVGEGTGTCAWQGASRNGSPTTSIRVSAACSTSVTPSV